MAAAQLAECLDEAVNEHAASRIVGLSVKTLRNKRVNGSGPPFVKSSPGRGGRVAYVVADLIAYRDARRVHSTSEVAG